MTKRVDINSKASDKEDAGVWTEDIHSLHRVQSRF